jgi:hypothetical protein
MPNTGVVYGWLVVTLMLARLPGQTASWLQSSKCSLPNATVQHGAGVSCWQCRRAGSLAIAQSMPACVGRLATSLVWYGCCLQASLGLGRARRIGQCCFIVYAYRMLPAMPLNPPAVDGVLWQASGHWHRIWGLTGWCCCQSPHSGL